MNLLFIFLCLLNVYRLNAEFMSAIPDSVNQRLVVYWTTFFGSIDNNVDVGLSRPIFNQLLVLLQVEEWGDAFTTQGDNQCDAWKCHRDEQSAEWNVELFVLAHPSISIVKDLHVTSRPSPLTFPQIIIVRRLNHNWLFCLMLTMLLASGVAAILND